MTYYLFDNYFGKEWLIEVNMTKNNINWNPKYKLHERFKKMYLKLYKEKIIETAKKI